MYIFRDNNKPINVLTGIDYWLDNLICNVPELVMCFHVNGIVQVRYSVTFLIISQVQVGAESTSPNFLRPLNTKVHFLARKIAVNKLKFECFPHLSW